jgi:hypothetical protein
MTHKHLIKKMPADGHGKKVAHKSGRRTAVPVTTHAFHSKQIKIKVFIAQHACWPARLLAGGFYPTRHPLPVGFFKRHIG